MQENKENRKYSRPESETGGKPEKDVPGRKARTSGRKSGGARLRKALLAFAAVILLAGAAAVIVKYTPTNKRMSDAEYFGSMEQDEAAIILGDQMIPERALVKEDDLYLPYNIVQGTLNGRFYWDADIAKMLLTTATQEFEIPVNSTSYSVIDGVCTTDPVSEGSYDKIIIFRPDDGRITGKDAEDGGNTTGLYVSADFLQKYTQVEYTLKKDSTGESQGHVLIRYQWGDALTARTFKEAAVRFQGGIKSPILTDLAKGDSFYVLEQGDRWTRVLTEDGYIGYVKNSRISEPQTTNVMTEIKAPEYPSLTSEDRITVVWHQMSTKDGNDGLDDITASMSGADVISPTWFSLADNDGNITSIGSKKYVKAAKKKGLKVWGLVSDFSGDMDTSAVLASTAARRNCIGQLVDEAESLGIDGINLDFEYMEEADAHAYVQFVRELSIECRNSSLVLSVDIKPPYDFNYWMDRKEIGTVADYLINMGYDEHYTGSEAGSVASLPYEQQAIEETLRQGVPAEKIITAIPFYTRIWYTSENSDGSLNTESEVLSMSSVSETLKSWNVTPSWDADTAQHYADWTTGDGVRCRIWIEDADSIAEKVRLVPQYDLGGVAAWRLGFQSSDVWRSISANRDLSQEEAEAAQQEADSAHAQEIQAAEEETGSETEAEAETERQSEQ